MKDSVEIGLGHWTYATQLLYIETKPIMQYTNRQQNGCIIMNDVNESSCDTDEMSTNDRR